MKFQQKRLKELATFLRTKVPTTCFRMNTWLEGSPTKLRAHACGTAACALGWACMIPRFKKLGLRFKLTTRNAGYPIYRSYRTLEASEKFFGLRQEEAALLFDFRNGCTTPEDVAHRIDQLIVEHSS